MKLYPCKTPTIEIGTVELIGKKYLNMGTLFCELAKHMPKVRLPYSTVGRPSYTSDEVDAYERQISCNVKLYYSSTKLTVKDLTVVLRSYVGGSTEVIWGMRDLGMRMMVIVEGYSVMNFKEDKLRNVSNNFSAMSRAVKALLDGKKPQFDTTEKSHMRYAWNKREEMWYTILGVADYVQDTFLCTAHDNPREGLRTIYVIPETEIEP